MMLRYKIILELDLRLFTNQFMNISSIKSMTFKDDLTNSIYDY